MPIEEKKQHGSLIFKKKIGETAKKVLDIGTGTGFLSIMLAEMGYEVVGLDISE
ncbi:MAG: class I SAM-dependent methyltransferase, partial [Candidatus Syntropharchaeia archaeon]